MGRHIDVNNEGGFDTRPSSLYWQIEPGVFLAYKDMSYHYVINYQTLLRVEVNDLGWVDWSIDIVGLKTGKIYALWIHFVLFAIPQCIKSVI